MLGDVGETARPGAEARAYLRPANPAPLTFVRSGGEARLMRITLQPANDNAPDAHGHAQAGLLLLAAGLAFLTLALALVAL